MIKVGTVTWVLKDGSIANVYDDHTVVFFNTLFWKYRTHVIPLNKDMATRILEEMEKIITDEEESNGNTLRP